MAYKAERPWGREGAQGSGWGGDSGGNADRDQGEGGDLGNMPGPVWDFMDVGGSKDIQGGGSQEASGPLV